MSSSDALRSKFTLSIYMVVSPMPEDEPGATLTIVNSSKGAGFTIIVKTCNNGKLAHPFIAR